MLRLLTIGPIIASIPIVAVYHIGTYIYWRPKRGLARHLGVNVFRYLGAAIRLGCVAIRDPEEASIPKLAKYHRHLADAGEPRTIPPIKDDVPRLPVLESAGDKIKAAPFPGFMLAPKGTPQDDIWARATPGEKGIFYIVGGGYEVGHPLQFFCPWDLVNETGLRLFSEFHRS
jgi:hypothetical protein